MKVKTYSERETINTGKKFARILKERDVVVLEGDLGGGKTTFVKGLLKGLGSKQRVLSPSFTLMREYKVKKLFVYHLDLYRLKRADALNLGLEDFLYSDKSISLIEWGGKVKQDLDKYIKVEFSFLGENSRCLEFSVKSLGEDRIEGMKVE